MQHQQSLPHAAAALAAARQQQQSQLHSATAGVAVAYSSGNNSCSCMQQQQQQSQLEAAAATVAAACSSSSSRSWKQQQQQLQLHAAAATAVAAACSSRSCMQQQPLQLHAAPTACTKTSKQKQGGPSAVGRPLNWWGAPSNVRCHQEANLGAPGAPRLAPLKGYKTSFGGFRREGGPWPPLFYLKGGAPLGGPSGCTDRRVPIA
ncbi:hypothetical protein Emed_001342 [Eimeria media]